MTQHPITPSPELVVQWIKEFSQPNDPRWQEYEQDIATRAAQWGADQELDACCEWINSFQNKFVHAHDLRLVRRPKPPSLKEQALVVLDDIPSIDGAHYNTIRRALEQLPDDK